MKILVEGTREEIKRAKDVLSSTCLFDSKFCDLYESCEECESKQVIEITYRSDEGEDSK